MCGIAAIIQRPESSLRRHDLARMSQLVRHRGPDGFSSVELGGSELTDRLPDGASFRVGLAHRRLSIIDLSPLGEQPMRYGDTWITYNGEVYNFIELRRELAQRGHVFRSDSDTEVILAAYAEWGLECFRRLRGMWGLVLVDVGRRRAVVSRDRLGIKPLYLAAGPGYRVAVSEIKQLTALRDLHLRPDDDAVRDYLATGYEDIKRTFFERVTAFPAGTVALIDLDTLAISAPQSFWEPEQAQITVTDPKLAAERVRSALTESVRLHLRSDVPVGSALSGGVDSSSIVALIRQIQRSTTTPLHTFTASFPGDAVDEYEHAHRVAVRVDASAHYVTPHPQALLGEIDEFVFTHDEPVGSLSQYAGYCVARIARANGVPVALNGQGGDEVLSGYWQSYLAWLQRTARDGDITPVVVDLFRAALPGGNRELLKQIPPMARRFFYKRRAARGLVGSRAREKLEQLLAMSPAERRLYEIRAMHLPRLLKWDDRNFMAFGVEGRYPFLDHEFIDTCLEIAPSALMRHGWTKAPLRRAVADLLPSSIVWRKDKRGFEPPEAKWAKGRLRSALTTLTVGGSPILEYISKVDLRHDVGRTTGDPTVPREVVQRAIRALLADRWLRVFFAGSTETATADSRAYAAAQ